MANGVCGAGDVLGVGLVAAPDFGLLLGISADDANAGKIFLDASGERGESGLDGFVQVVDRFAEEPDCDGHDRRGKSEEHTSELQSHLNLVCRLLLEKKKNIK